MSFKLKVIRTGLDTLIADTKSVYGGTDVEQIDAFNHLIPSGSIDDWQRDRLFNLARIHGWDIEIRDWEKETE